MQDLLTKFANLTIQSDFIFKKVMSRKRICKHLLEELLQIEIADINYIEIEAEKTLDPNYTSHGIRLDIIVADDKNTHYNLEMQVKNKKNPQTKAFVLPKRSRYYQALLDFDLLQAGQPYDLLRLLSSSSAFLISLKRVTMSTPLKSAVWRIWSLSFRMKQLRCF